MEGVELLTGIVFPYLNLAVFLVLATLVLGGPFKKILAAKRTVYLDLVKQANQAKEEAELRYSDLQKRMQSLDGEIEAMRSQAKLQGDQDAKLLRANAEQLALHLTREAGRIAAAEVAAAKTLLQADIMQQVKKLTIEQLQQNLNDSRQHQIVQRNIGSLGKVHAEVLS